VEVSFRFAAKEGWVWALVIGLDVRGIDRRSLVWIGVFLGVISRVVVFTPPLYREWGATGNRNYPERHCGIRWPKEYQTNGCRYGGREVLKPTAQ